MISCCKTFVKGYFLFYSVERGRFPGGGRTAGDDLAQRRSGFSGGSEILADEGQTGAVQVHDGPDPHTGEAEFHDEVKFGLPAADILEPDHMGLPKLKPPLCQSLKSF